MPTRFTNQYGYSPVVLDELHLDDLFFAGSTESVFDPGGNDTEIQYNNGGVRDGDSRLFFYNDLTLSVSLIDVAPGASNLTHFGINRELYGLCVDQHWDIH